MTTGNDHGQAATITTGGNRSGSSSRKRLRKFPDLLKAVDEGVISLESAALIAGIKRPRVRVRTDDVVLAVRVLLKHYEAQDIAYVLGDFVCVECGDIVE